ncbi:hypothetical protein FOXYS1_6074, partial [Fusarium oxysporum]
MAFLRAPSTNLWSITLIGLMACDLLADPPRRQGQQTTVASPRQDLRVFIRLEARSSGQGPQWLRDPDPDPGKTRHRLGQDSTGIPDKQAEWAAELGATAVETNKEWHTYVVSDFPRRLTDFRGNEVESDSVVSDEIEIQTGLRPADIRTGRQFSDNPLTKTLLVSFLKPIKRFWSLFGSRAARLIDKTVQPKQCKTCWDYHFARNCRRQPVCRSCGKTDHIADGCAAPEQYVNCLGPHEASL